MIIADRKQGKRATVQKAPPPVQEADLLCDTGYQKCRRLSTGLVVHYVIDATSLGVGVEAAESDAVSVYQCVRCFFVCRRQHCNCAESNSLSAPSLPSSPASSFINQPPLEVLNPPNPLTHLVLSLLGFFFLMIIKIPLLSLYWNSCSDR